MVEFATCAERRFSQVFSISIQLCHSSKISVVRSAAGIALDLFLAIFASFNAAAFQIRKVLRNIEVLARHNVVSCCCVCVCRGLTPFWGRAALLLLCVCV